mgnify:CR=1 FL=1
MTPQIIAHRGASYLAPENTLTAFKKAMELGADGVEMDVQQTSDAGLVIHHDYMIDLHTDISGKIYDMTMGDLKTLDFGSWKDVLFKDEKIATLQEAMELCRQMPGCTVHLELKSTMDNDPDFVPRVLEVLQQTEMVEQVILVSFNHALLRQAKQLLPELRVGALVYGELESLLLPPPIIWKDLGLTNGMDEMEAMDTVLPESTADEENCSWMTRWMSDKVSMLRASFPGESLNGVYSANEYLTRVNLMKAYKEDSRTPIMKSKSVAVVGGGNVAMDCCRTARRLMKGGRVTVSYRRTRASAPADPEEIKAAMEEDIGFEFLTAPVEVIVEDGRVTGIRLVRMAEGEPDASGRRSVRPVEGSEFVVPCRYVIAAIGQKLDTSIFCEADGIRLTKRGTIEVDESLRTSREGVFAGGDASSGPTSLIWGMAQGQNAAMAIHEYLMTDAPGFNPRLRFADLIRKADLLGKCVPDRPVVFRPRREIGMLSAAERVGNWEEVEHGLTESDAREEAKRCLRCYRLFGVKTLFPIPGKSAMDEL